MKRTDDPTGLQFLFTGLLAVGLALQLIGIFVYRLYTQRPGQDETTKQDGQQ